MIKPLKTTYLKLIKYRVINISKRQKMQVIIPVVKEQERKALQLLRREKWQIITKIHKK